MADKDPIDEHTLDDLLRNLYLNEKSEIVDENEAKFIMEQNYDVKIDPEKEKQLLNKLHKKSGGFGRYKLFLSVFLVLIFTSLLIWFLIPKTNHSLNNLANVNQQNNLIKQTNSTNRENAEIKENTPINGNANLANTIPDTFGRVSVQKIVVENDSIKQPLPENKIQVLQKPETKVPFITDKDKIRYTTIKNQMLLKLIKGDKGLYTHIMADKMDYNGKSVVVGPFTIRNMGITNLEYKTFLADLLIQKRDKDYLLAQVNSNNWNFYGCPTLANTYFQSEQYNDFPVVNVTIEGAKLFCKWLEEETKLYITQNNLKEKLLSIRLPYDEEWIYVAQAGYAKIPYEKGYNTIFDLEEGLVDKSFINRIELIKKRANRSDTLYHLLATNRYGLSEQNIIESFSAAFKAYSVLPSDTLISNRMKAFGKIAYVSQLVTEKKSSRIWLIGISWKNKDEYIKMQNEFKPALSSPFVGFRPVIVNANDGEFKTPF